jgi:group I intron endonuclease
MRSSGIYQIQSIAHPEKCYIGSALVLSKRWRTHLWNLRRGTHHSRALQNHFNKYGEADLVFAILELCLPAFLIPIEQGYLDNKKPYFNTCLTAGSILGHKFSEETKEKMRKKFFSEETRQKMREAALRNGRKPPSCKGIKRSEEFKAKLRGNKNAAGQIHTPERRKQHGDKIRGHTAWNKGLKLPPFSEEWKQHMKDSNAKRKAKEAREAALRNKNAA